MWTDRAKMCPIPLLLSLSVLWAGAVVCGLDVPAEDSPATNPASLTVWHCDFAEDLCGLTSVDTFEGTWERVETINPVPVAEDSWSVALAPGMSAGDKARLMSPILPPSNTPRCLTFYYYLDGAEPGQLTLLLREGAGPGVTVWTRGRSEGPQWKAANIDLTLKAAVSVVFEGVRGGNLRSVVGLDEIRLENDTCDTVPPIEDIYEKCSCTFEAGTCGWQNVFENVNVTEDTNDWLQGSGDNHLNDAGPEADHYNDTSGNFLYVDGLTTGTAVLESQLFGSEQHNDFCFSFWYYIQDEMGDKMTISVVAESGKETEVWAAGVTDGWALGQVRVKTTELIFMEVAYQLYIRATRTSDKSVIALDDFSFKKKIECPRVPQTLVTKGPSASSTPSPSELWSCYFSENMCGLNLSGEGDWSLYINVNTTEHNHDRSCLGFIGSKGQEGRAALPHLDAQEDPSCLSFWYMIESANRGNLSVMLTSENTGGSETLWSRSEAGGNVWIKADVHVPLVGFTLVEFVAVMGFQTEGLLGIDDILLVTGGCNHVYPDSGWCDFEDSSVCGFSTQPGLKDWVWVSPLQDQVISLTPHIPADHTYQTGYGHYMEAVLVASDHEGVVGRLRTPWISQPQDTPMCISFWYVHNGATNKDSLSVFANISGSLGYHLWQEKASYIDTWLSASVPIPGGGQQSVQVLWEAWQSEREDNSSMAVDDVKITMLPCDTLGSCTFVYGTCGWQNVLSGEELTDETDWLVGSGKTAADLDAPDKDHTGDSEGLFLYVDSMFAETGRAMLQSQMFVPEEGNNLCFHFWFYLKGDNVSLIIELEAAGSPRKDVWHQDVASDQWEEGQVHVKAEQFLIAKAYQIFITGARNSKYDVIAVDDFNFTKFLDSCPVLPQTVTTTSTTPAPQSVSCTFSVDQCGWQNIYSHPLSWIRDSDQHQMALKYDKEFRKAPEAEFNMQKHNEGSVSLTEAELRSPVFNIPAGATYCLSLSWRVQTQEDAHFAVVLEMKDGLLMGYLLSERGGSGGVWKTSSMEIAVEGNHRVAVIAQIGAIWDGFMAFTNILLEDQQCTEGYVNGTFWCDFEADDKCNFLTSLPMDNSVWTWGTGYPYSDHTLSTNFGHSMFMDVASVGKNKMAHMVTPGIWPVSDPYCITFWFYIPDPKTGTLTIFAFRDEEMLTSIWSSENNNFHLTWRGASLSIFTKEESFFYVLFEAITGEETWGSISVDDVKVSPGSCPLPVECNFDEEDLCLWSQNEMDDLNWLLHSELDGLGDFTGGK